MSVLHRGRDVPVDPSVTPPRQDVARPAVTPPPDGGVPRTRTGTAWVGIWIAAVALVVLVVFMMQNTRSVEITFLWMHGRVPLALALLVAGVGVAVLAMAVGGARVGQLRRLARRRG